MIKGSLIVLVLARIAHKAFLAFATENSPLSLFPSMRSKPALSLPKPEGLRGRAVTKVQPTDACGSSGVELTPLRVRIRSVNLSHADIYIHLPCIKKLEFVYICIHIYNTFRACSIPYEAWICFACL